MEGETAKSTEQDKRQPTATACTQIKKCQEQSIMGGMLTLFSGKSVCSKEEQTAGMRGLYAVAGL